MFHLIKIVLSVIYIGIFILSTFVLELFIYINLGHFSDNIITPSQLQNFSIKELQTLLENRGVSTASLWEKDEYIHALQSTGPVKIFEIHSATQEDHSKVIELGTFEEYFEQVSEDKESVWLMEIIADENEQRIMNAETWQAVKKRLRPVGINTAIFRCSFDKNLCEKYGWNQPQLVFIVPKYPRNFKNLQSPLGPPSAQAVLSYIEKEFSNQITYIEDINELENEWLNTTSVRQEKVSRMILFTNLLNPPLLFLTLGLRFSTRVNFGIFDTNKLDDKQASFLKNKYKLNEMSGIVFSSDSIKHYGYNPGEIITSESLEAYIRMTQPRLSEIFMTSLFLVNFFAVLSFINFRLEIWRNLIVCVLFFPLYSLILFVGWVILTHSMKFSVVKKCVDLFLSVVISCSSIKVIRWLLYYYSVVNTYPQMVILSFLILIAVCFIGREYFRSLEQPEEESWGFLFNLDNFLINILFRPMTNMSWTQDSLFEDGMDLIIERLATPDLWLHPLVPKDYITRLPIWRYDGWGNEEDLKSESETDLESDADCDQLLSSHECCEQNSCKLCDLWATVKETYVCHRCAIIKRKLEKQYLRLCETGDQQNTYEKLLKVFENCYRWRKNSQNEKGLRKNWPLSLQKLVAITWSAPSYAIESRTCVICLDRYRWSAVLCGLPCGHTFHHSCIVEWLQKDHHQCPTCRWPSYKSKEHKISH